MSQISLEAILRVLDVSESVEKAEGSGRTNEALWSKSKSRAKAKLGGKWSARAAQLAGKYYRDAGGKYSGPKSEGQKSLSKWTGEKWSTKDGEKAERKGKMHRYLPKEAWDKLTPAERAATDRKKVEGGKGGKQFVANTESAARASKEVRKVEDEEGMEKSVGTTSPESAQISTKRYRDNPKNKAKLRAKWAAQSAVRSGKLNKPSSCPSCGRNVKLDFHHTDKSYSEGSQLKGKWCCRKCHSTRLDPARSGKAMSDSMKKAKPTNA